MVSDVLVYKSLNHFWTKKSDSVELLFLVRMKVYNTFFYSIIGSKVFSLAVSF